MVCLDCNNVGKKCSSLDIRLDSRLTHLWNMLKSDWNVITLPDSDSDSNTTSRAGKHLQHPFLWVIFQWKNSEKTRSINASMDWFAGEIYRKPARAWYMLLEPCSSRDDSSLRPANQVHPAFFFGTKKNYWGWFTYYRFTWLMELNIVKYWVKWYVNHC
jgi:hypothetical protein